MIRKSQWGLENPMCTCNYLLGPRSAPPRADRRTPADGSSATPGTSETAMTTRGQTAPPGECAWNKQRNQLLPTQAFTSQLKSQCSLQKRRQAKREQKANNKRKVRNKWPEKSIGTWPVNREEQARDQSIEKSRHVTNDQRRAGTWPEKSRQVKNDRRRAGTWRATRELTDKPQFVTPTIKQELNTRKPSNCWPPWAAPQCVTSVNSCIVTGQRVMTTVAVSLRPHRRPEGGATWGSCPPWNLKMMTSYAVPVENTLKLSLKRWKNRNNFCLCLWRAEK